MFRFTHASFHARRRSCSGSRVQALARRRSRAGARASRHLRTGARAREGARAQALAYCAQVLARRRSRAGVLAIARAGACARRRLRAQVHALSRAGALARRRSRAQALARAGARARIIDGPLPPIDSSHGAFRWPHSGVVPAGPFLSNNNIYLHFHMETTPFCSEAFSLIPNDLSELTEWRSAHFGVVSATSRFAKFLDRFWHISE